MDEQLIVANSDFCVSAREILEEVEILLSANGIHSNTDGSLTDEK